MSAIITGQIWCPLCEKQMQSANIQLRDKVTKVYFCNPCKIGIYDFDPAFNKWRDADKDIPCAACGHDKVRWFARFIDGFFKAYCPKCKTTMKKDGDVQFKKSGAIIIPEDMEPEDTEKPIEIKIPLSHIIKKIGKDKYNELKNKRQSKKIKRKGVNRAL